MPKVSVITPLYNGAPHIAGCIESVAAQDFTDLEHIVIDNNSTDNGPAIVRDLQERHPHLILISEPEKGPGPARNAGIRQAKGRYIAFLDADDMWKPEKIRLQIEAMQASGAVFSWSAYDVIKNDRFIRIQSAPETMTIDDLLRKKAVIGCLTAVYDMELLGRMYFPCTPGIHEDFCLWHDILLEASANRLPVLGLSAPLATYRVHADGISADKTKAARMQWRTYRSHVGLSRTRTTQLFLGYAIRATRVRIGSTGRREFSPA